MKSFNWVVKRTYFILILIMLCLSGCARNTDTTEETGTYIINTRSTKIHSTDCPYVKQMSDTNKKTVRESLINLLRQDYTICRRCKAGMRKSSVAEIIDKTTHSNLYVDDAEISASVLDYQNAVSIISEWYVDHVPTYASKIQEEDYSKYGGNLNRYKDYHLKNKGKNKTYKVLTLEPNANNCNTLSASDQILRAKESAAAYYLEEYSNIKFKKKIAYYPCNEISKESDYNTPGDDCVRYLFAVFNRMDSQFTQKFKRLTGYSYSKTNSKSLATNKKDIAFGMNTLGFKIYDIESSIINVNNDGIPEGYIFKTEDNFRLQKGDILARDGHVHIYLGDGVALKADNFGWGRVYRSFPQKYDIQVKKLDDGLNYVVLTNGNGDAEYYTRIYRYAGNGK